MIQAKQKGVSTPNPDQSYLTGACCPPFPQALPRGATHQLNDLSLAKKKLMHWFSNITSLALAVPLFTSTAKGARASMALPSALNISRTPCRHRSRNSSTFCPCTSHNLQD
eukprot:966191-Pelagomonas_calceolata.AAC.1